MADKAALQAAIGGKQPAKEPSGEEQRDARRGRVACTDKCVDPQGCSCVYGCYIGQGDKAKPKHILVELKWACPSSHGSDDWPGENQADYRMRVIVQQQMEERE